MLPLSKCEDNMQLNTPVIKPKESKVAEEKLKHPMTGLHIEMALCLQHEGLRDTFWAKHMASGCSDPRTEELPGSFGIHSCSWKPKTPKLFVSQTVCMVHGVQDSLDERTCSWEEPPIL